MMAKAETRASKMAAETRRSTPVMEVVAGTRAPTPAVEVEVTQVSNPC
jgi:hypothetical protein